MVVVAVKKWCVKKGKRYGPYPKDPETFYLYRVHRNGETVSQEYLGKGPKPKDFGNLGEGDETEEITVVQEQTGRRVVKRRSLNSVGGLMRD